ncbi:hypothetical protein Landi51_12665 [Colletotrichum acutatum]
MLASKSTRVKTTGFTNFQVVGVKEDRARDDVERLLVIEKNARGSHQTTQHAAVVAAAATVTAALHDTASMTSCTMLSSHHKATRCTLLMHHNAASSKESQMVGEDRFRQKQASW